MATKLVGSVLALIFIAALIVATQREASVECEVCLVFEGQEACRTSRGADRTAATRGAIATACAVLSSGVTRGIQCDNTAPRMLQCSE